MTEMGRFQGRGGTKARTVAILFRWPAAPSVSTPKEMDRVIGAAFWVLARARVRLSQIRPEGEDPQAVQLEPLPVGVDEQAERVPALPAREGRAYARSRPHPRMARSFRAPHR